MKTIKANAIGTWVSLLSIFLSAAAMISYYVLSLDGEKSPSVVYLLTAASIVVQLLVMYLCRTGIGKDYNTSSLVAAILTAFALEQMMLGRVEWLGGLAAHNWPPCIWRSLSR